MANLVLIHRAAAESGYTARHISLLLRQGKVKGSKEGRIWLVDLDDLMTYKAAMDELGTQKYTPKSTLD